MASVPVEMYVMIKDAFGFGFRAAKRSNLANVAYVEHLRTKPGAKPGLGIVKVGPYVPVKFFPARHADLKAYKGERWKTKEVA